MLNVPPVVTAILTVLVTVHAIGALLPDGKAWLLLWFSFIPARYDVAEVTWGGPAGLGPQIWTFVSYALLHGSLLHLVMESVKAANDDLAAAAVDLVTPLLASSAVLLLLGLICLFCSRRLGKTAPQPSTPF